MLTTVANVIDELQTDNSRTAYITRLIQQAGAAIERHCNRAFTRVSQADILVVRRTVRSDLRLVLPRKPLITLTSIVYTDSGTVVAGTEYSIEDKPGAILYRANGWSGQPGYNPQSNAYWNDLPPIETRYTVTYDAGYDPMEGSPGSPAAPVPADLERACIDTVKEYWYGGTRDRNVRMEEVAGVGRQDYWNRALPDGSTPALPAHVIGLLSPYCRIVL